ncbi:hypothetical protein ACEUZ9_002190 [Paracoccus litorisediminis]|uniref:hypothetical protein n=1 Tax=Paracoccus litorisediminis TaxID=2006130 RepID=UPI0037319374
MSHPRPIAGGEPVSHPPVDPDRSLIADWLSKNPVTVYPPDRRVAPARPAPKAGIPPAVTERQAPAAPRIRVTARSEQAGITRTMTVQQALTWAFAVEHAQLDFDQYGAHEFEREGIDPLWRGMRMQELGGVLIHGSGGNDPHVDAQIIVGALENLTFQGLITRNSATRVAELARADRSEDWGRWDRPACIPNGWDVSDTGSVYRWKTRKREKREVKGKFCPVIYTGFASTISDKRQKYHDWCEALLHLAYDLGGRLHTIEIIDALPPLTPWQPKAVPGA